MVTVTEASASISSSGKCGSVHSPGTVTKGHQMLSGNLLLGLRSWETRIASCTRPLGTQESRALLQSDQTTGTKEHLTSLSRESPSSYVGQSPMTVQSKWEQVMGSRRNSRDKTNFRNHQETTLSSRQLILIKVPRTPMEAVFRISKHPLPCISQVFMWRT